MIFFPNIKLNIGLNVTSKRDDGYHNIETVFYPIKKPCDILEIINNENDNEDYLTVSGINLYSNPNDNLIIKAINKLRENYDFPPLRIHLHKNIPAGSGLGGGSSDAAHTLLLINEQYSLNMTDEELKQTAQTIGADCAFFLKNIPLLAKGIGSEFTKISLSLSGYWIQIVVPPINISTKEAYAGIIPMIPQRALEELITLPIELWKENIKNDFETPIFNMHKELSEIKTKLYNQGAVYSSMTGSGSSIYGIFKNKPEIEWNNNYDIFTELIE